MKHPAPIGNRLKFHEVFFLSLISPVSRTRACLSRAGNKKGAPVDALVLSDDGGA